MKDIVILYSGGMDSSVALYEHADRIRLAITFNYGSKHNLKINEIIKKIKHRLLILWRPGVRFPYHTQKPSNTL